MATYAVADIHGQLNTLLAGLEKIGFSASDQLYVIGDAIDRGPEGVKILQMIMSEPNMDLIIGNHEFMMLNSVDHEGDKGCNGGDATLWLHFNGGNTTYRQYKNLNQADRRNLIEWLNNRFVMKTVDVEGKQFCLSHSYYKQGLEDIKYKDMGYCDVWNIVWTSIFRDDYETHGEYIYGDYNYIFITGHVPVQRIRQWIEPEDNFNCLKIFMKGNLVDIDGGCSLGLDDRVNNGLIFLRLNDMEQLPVPIMR